MLLLILCESEKDIAFSPGENNIMRRTEDMESADLVSLPDAWTRACYFTIRSLCFPIYREGTILCSSVEKIDEIFRLNPSTVPGT